MRLRINVVFYFLIVISHTMIGQDFDDGLVFYYSFDDNLIDLSSNSLDLLGVSYSFGNDRFGNPNKSIILNSSAEVNMPNSPLIKRNYPMSFSLWVYLPASSNGQHNPLFDNNFVIDSYHGINPSIYNDGQVAFSIGNGLQSTGPNNRKTFLTYESITYDEWHHIVFLSSLGNTEIYVDGCLWESEINGNGTDFIAYNSDLGRLGVRDNSTYTGDPFNYFDGLMDDFYMWDRIITEEEISLLYDDFHKSSYDIVEDRYIIKDGQELSITVSEEFMNVKWSDGQEGNVGVFQDVGVFTVSAEIGCQLTQDTFLIERKEKVNCIIGYPNSIALSSGLSNDIYTISTNDEACINGLEIEVFDRWGNSVYNDSVILLNEGSQDFTEYVEGIYTYIITGANINGEYRHSGTFTVFD